KALHHVRHANSRGADRLARATHDAFAQVPLDIGGDLEPPLRVSAHEIDPPSRRARLAARRLVGGAIRDAEPTVDAIERSTVLGEPLLERGRSLGRNAHGSIDLAPSPCEGELRAQSRPGEKIP